MCDKSSISRTRVFGCTEGISTKSSVGQSLALLGFGLTAHGHDAWLFRASGNIAAAEKEMLGLRQGDVPPAPPALRKPH